MIDNDIMLKSKNEERVSNIVKKTKHILLYSDGKHIFILKVTNILFYYCIATAHIFSSLRLQIFCLTFV
jgi:hypothetical protein